MTLYKWLAVSLILGLSLTSCAKQSEGHARVAVATNFLNTAQKLEAAFEAETDYKIDLVSGSTGQLYTQIINGAPYDVFLSADAARVTKLIEGGHGLEETRFTYAIGRLVLFGVEKSQSVLRTERDNKLAIANPDIAPYGAAAIEVIKALDTLELGNLGQLKIIYGQNVGQVYAFVKTGNADLGFVALSQMKGAEGYWIVPTKHYSTIFQDAILLRHGNNSPSAIAFLNYLKSAPAQALIKSSGYANVPS